MLGVAEAFSASRSQAFDPCASPGLRGMRLAFTGVIMLEVDNG
jgi:hypothetical protein